MTAGGIDRIMRKGLRAMEGGLHAPMPADRRGALGAGGRLGDSLARHYGGAEAAYPVCAAALARLRQGLEDAGAAQEEIMGLRMQGLRDMDPAGHARALEAAASRLCGAAGAKGTVEHPEGTGAGAEAAMAALRAMEAGEHALQKEADALARENRALRERIGSLEASLKHAEDRNGEISALRRKEADAASREMRRLEHEAASLRKELEKAGKAAQAPPAG